MCDRLWSMAYIELRNIEVYIYAQGEVLVADVLSQFCLVGSMTLPTNSGTSFTLSLMMKRKGLSTWSSAVLMNADRGTNSMPVAKDNIFHTTLAHGLKERPPSRHCRRHKWKPLDCTSAPLLGTGCLHVNVMLHGYQGS